MRGLFLFVGLSIWGTTHADPVRLVCTSDKVFSIYRTGDTYESHEAVNKLTTFVLIDSSKSEIKISWRNDTYNTTGDIDMKIIDVRNAGKVILGLRTGSDDGYELHQFDLENLQTSWTLIDTTGDMYMLSKCFESN